MDPNQALRELLDAAEGINSGNSRERVADYVEHAYDLRGWLESGGFPPNDPELIRRYLLAFLPRV